MSTGSVVVGNMVTPAGRLAARFQFGASWAADKLSLVKVLALTAVPLLLTPMLGKFAPKGVLVTMPSIGSLFVNRPAPARTTVLPSPLTSQATPTRGNRYPKPGLYSWEIGAPGPTCCTAA